MIVAYVLLFTFLADAQYEAHHTSVFDLGVYDQVIWNTAHGRLLTYSAEPEFGSNFLATHLQPILILLAPLYWFWDDVRVLFVAQTLALALGAIPVFALTLRRTHSHFAAMVLSASYLLLPALEAANLFDFHPETFAPALCLTIFWLLDSVRGNEQRNVPRWIALWLCVLLTLALNKVGIAARLLARDAACLAAGREPDRRRCALVRRGRLCGDASVPPRSTVSISQLLCLAR